MSLYRERKELRKIATAETVFMDQEVELEVLQAFPTFLVCEDGTLAGPDGTLIQNPDAGEIL